MEALAERRLHKTCRTYIVTFLQAQAATVTTHLPTLYYTAPDVAIVTESSRAMAVGRRALSPTGLEKLDDYSSKK